MKCGVYLQLVVTGPSFCFFAYKNGNAMARIPVADVSVSVSGRFYIPIFAFLFIKIITWEQQLEVCLASCMYCFCFSNHKNSSARVAVPAANQASCIYVCCFFY